MKPIFSALLIVLLVGCTAQPQRPLRVLGISENGIILQSGDGPAMFYRYKNRKH